MANKKTLHAYPKCNADNFRGYKIKKQINETTFDAYQLNRLEV